MGLRIYQADAFTDTAFRGNPAAVCPMPYFYPDADLQNIASEMNLSETAFIVPDGSGNYQIRWFTPEREVRLCGHATLASAHIIFTELNHESDRLSFRTLHAGTLLVSRAGENYYSMDFPLDTAKLTEGPPTGEWVDKSCMEAYRGTDDLMLVLESEADVRECLPVLGRIREQDFRALIVTAEGDKHDFVSRVFVPSCGIDEDPVTGSAHTLLTAFWSERLGKPKLKAAQLSRRGGELTCERKGNRVLISGHAVSVLKGELI